MFEIVVTLCLLSAPDTCRDVLIAGYEAPDMAACAEKLDDQVVIPAFDKLTPDAPPRCQAAGKIAQFSEVAPGVFVHRGAVSDAGPHNYGDIANTGFIIGQTAVAVIDTGGSRQVGEEIYRAIRAQTDLPISDVILSHMHPDHVLGAGVFAELGARVIGHAKLESALKDRAGTYLDNLSILVGRQQFIGTYVALPDTPVIAKLSVDLGGRVLELQSWQTSHTTSDLTVFDPTSGVLFTGDLVFDEHTPALDGSVRGWVAVLEAMADIPARQIVPGHGGPLLDWPDGALDLSRYLEVLIRDTKQALDAGQSLSSAAETIGLTEAGNWALFDLFNARNATVAFTELEWE